MPVIALDTASVPPVSAPSTPPTIASIGIDGGTAPSSPTIATGDLAPTLISKFNNHSARVDVGAMAMIGIPAIITGLVVSAGVGLTADVADGQAFIQGITEYGGGGVVVAASNTSRIWLGTDGVLHSGTGAYVPASPAIYLGSVTAGASTITSVDASGVFTMAGGLPRREVADTLEPADDPDAGAPIHITKTAGGTYLWDGEAYNLLVPVSAITSLSTGATTSQIVTYLRSLGLATS